MRKKKTLVKVRNGAFKVTHNVRLDQESEKALKYCQKSLSKSSSSDDTQVLFSVSAIVRKALVDYQTKLKAIQGRGRNEKIKNEAGEIRYLAAGLATPCDEHTCVDDEDAEFKEMIEEDEVPW